MFRQFIEDCIRDPKTSGGIREMDKGRVVARFGFGLAESGSDKGSKLLAFEKEGKHAHRA